MEYEEDRKSEIKEDSERKIEKLEEKAAKVRIRVAKEMLTLARHEGMFSRKESAGKDTSSLRECIEKKRELVGVLDIKLEELELTCKMLRNQIERLLSFNPVQDTLNDMPRGFHVAGKAEWRVKNSRFKTFQDVFTPVGTRVLPNNHYQRSKKEYDDLPLDVCPVDPELVPDWFIEEFDLGSVQGMNRFEALERKANISPEIRRFFAHLHPTTAHGESSYRMMTPEAYDPEHDGKVLRFSYTSREKETVEDRKIVQSHDDVYTAHRGVHHVDHGKKKEMAKIHGVIGRVDMINRDIIGKKEGDPELKRLTDELLKEIALIEGSRNFYKAEAHGIMVEISDIKDSLGKHNPGASCSKLAGALGKLKKRLPQMFKKNQYNLEDRQILGETIQKSKRTMDTAFQRYLELCQEIEKGGDEKAIRQRLAKLPDLSDLRVRPFSQYAATMNEKKAAILTALSQNDMEAVRDEAIDGYVAAKTFQAQHERERILRDMASSDVDISVDELLIRSIDLRENVRAKETFPNVRTCSNEAYDEMAVQLNILVGRLEHYNAKGLTGPERQAMYDRLKLYLEKINFTEVLEKLPHQAKM